MELYEYEISREKFTQNKDIRRGKKKKKELLGFQKCNVEKEMQNMQNEGNML